MLPDNLHAVPHERRDEAAQSLRLFRMRTRVRLRPLPEIDRARNPGGLRAAGCHMPHPALSLARQSLQSDLQPHLLSCIGANFVFGREWDLPPAEPRRFFASAAG